MDEKQLKKLHKWCVQNAVDRVMGKLSQDKIDKLDALGFPWEVYEQYYFNMCSPQKAHKFSMAKLEFLVSRPLIN